MTLQDNHPYYWLRWRPFSYNWYGGVPRRIMQADTTKRFPRGVVGSTKRIECARVALIQAANTTRFERLLAFRGG